MSTDSDSLDSDSAGAWTPATWRDHQADQQPDWPDAASLDGVVKTLSGLPAARLRR